MMTQVLKEADVVREASEILLEHLDPAKVARFWANWRIGQGDYLQWRDKQFGQETVAHLYEEIVSFQEETL
jgi:hypothetical protein